MGMQAHFELDDVLDRCAIILKMERHDEMPNFSGTIAIVTEEYPEGISFNITPDGGLPSNYCWADIAHDRAIVDWLIDQRIPFNAS